MSSLKTENKVDVFVVSSVTSLETKNETKKTKNSCFHINREMIGFKAHFFLFSGALALVMPYMTLFATTRVGFSGTTLGVLLTAQQLIFIFSKTAIGYITDYFNKLKEMICAEMLIYGLTMFLLLLIPSIERGTRRAHNVLEACSFEKAECNSSNLVKNMSYDECYNFLLPNNHKCSFFNFSIDTQIQCCGQIVEFLTEYRFDLSENSTCQVMAERNHSNGKETSAPSLSLQDSLELLSDNSTGRWVFCCETSGDFYRVSCRRGADIAIGDTKAGSDFYTYQFWTYAVVSTVGNVCADSMFTLSDTACCEGVQRHGSDFGKQELFAAAAWGSLSLLGGLLYDYTYSYLPAFIGMAVMSVLCIWNIYKMDLVKPHLSQRILKDVGTVLKSKEFLVFELGVIMCGVGTSVMWFYQAIFLTSIGASRLLYGLVLGVQCFVGQVPFLFFSQPVIDKLGHLNVISLSLLAYSMRFLWYSYLTNPWLTLPAEVLHGLTHGLFFPALATYAKKSAKPGTEATTQAVVFTTFEGIGASAGCMVFGIGYERLGWQKMFLYTGLFEAAGMVVMVICTLLLMLCRKRNKD